MDKRLHWAVSMTRSDEDGTVDSYTDSPDNNFTLRLAATPYQASKTRLAHVGLAYHLKMEEGFRFRARPEGRTKSVRLVTFAATPTGLTRSAWKAPWCTGRSPCKANT